MSSGIKKSTKVIVGVAILAAVAVVFLFRFVTLQPKAAPPSIEEIQAKEGIPVDVARAGLQDVKSRREISGTVEGVGQADVKSNYPMRIKKILVDQGDAVRLNQLLVTLDPLTSPSVYAQYEAARIQLSDAKRNLERMRPLFEAGAISQSEWDLANSGVKAAEAGVTDIEHSINLRSPIAGIVTNVLMKSGDMADPGDAIMTVSTTEKLKLVANVSQRDAAGIQVGTEASIVDQGGAGITGRVAKVALSANPETRLFRIEIEIDDASGILKSGTLHSAVLTIAEAPKVLAVPSRAVIEREGKRYVYLIKEGSAKLVPIEVGLSATDLVEVVGGLAEGDLVVVNGTNLLSFDKETKVLIHNPEEVGLPAKAAASEG